MPHTKEIEVYLIAKTNIIQDNVDQWLIDMGVPTETLQNYHKIYSNKTNGELLTELARRRCYKSFIPKLNPNVTKIREDIGKYLDNVLDSMHGCYDEKTEVLTKNGWKFWKQVTEEDEFATLNLKTNCVEYQKPTNLVSYYYNGKMYNIDAAQINLLVTPNHKLLVCKMTTKEGRKRNKFELITAEEINTLAHCHKKDAVWLHEKNKNYTNELLSLLGFAIGDGSKNKGHAVVNFHLRRERKIKYLHNLCKILKFPIQLKKNNWYSVVLPTQFNELFDKIYINKEKCIPTEILINTSKEQQEALFDGLINSDGSVTKGSILYDTTSEILAGQIQQLSLHIGSCSNISQANCYKIRTSSFGKKPIFRCIISKKTIKPEVNKFVDALSKSSWIENWSGMVYCAEVPNHTLYIRRMGKPVWSGNSITEHTTYTFAIENITRVFTGEMNRHRAGVAVSEGSMRYIRYEDMPFWMPLSLRENPSDSDDLARKKMASRQLITTAFQACEAVYRQFQILWKDELADNSNFHIKKQLTSMMRRIIPMGICTGGIWTGNIRALRHIFGVRCTEGAEEEICYVACVMLELMRREEPLLFKDFEQIEGFYKPRYWKV